MQKVKINLRPTNLQSPLGPQGSITRWSQSTRKWRGCVCMNVKVKNRNGKGGAADKKSFSRESPHLSPVRRSKSLCAINHPWNLCAANLYNYIRRQRIKESCFSAGAWGMSSGTDIGPHEMKANQTGSDLLRTTKWLHFTVYFFLSVREYGCIRSLAVLFQCCDLPCLCCQELVVMRRSLIVILAVSDHCGKTFTDQRLGNVSTDRAKQNGFHNLTIIYKDNEYRGYTV